MKKLVLGLILLASTSYGAVGALPGVVQTPIDTGSLAAALGVSQDYALSISNNGASVLTWQTVYSAAPTSITVLLEGSVDCSTYATIDTSTSTAGEIRSVFGSWKCVRFNNTAVGGGAGKTLTAKFVYSTGRVTGSPIGDTVYTSGRFTGPVYIGTDPRSVEAAGRIVELDVKGSSQPVEIHAEGGGSTGYAGFGARNDRLTDGSGNTLAGFAAVVYGSGTSAAFWGLPSADLAVVSNAGVNSSGLVLGSIRGPLVLGTTVTATGAQESRIYAPASCKTISDNVGAGFVRVGIPSGSIGSGKLDFLVYAILGADIQQRDGTVWWDARNPAGTEACGLGSTLGTDLISRFLGTVGTLTAAFTCTTGATNAIDITITADSSLASPTMGICWILYKTAGAGSVDPI